MKNIVRAGAKWVLILTSKGFILGLVIGALAGKFVPFEEIKNIILNL